MNGVPRIVVLGLLFTCMAFAGCATADVESDEDARRLPDSSSDAASDTADDLGIDTMDAGQDPDMASDPIDTAVDPVSDPNFDLAQDPVVDPGLDPDLVVDLPVETTGDPDVSDTVQDPDSEDLVDLPFGGGVLFTEIADHNANAGARYVEVYNATGYPVGLTGWSIELWEYNLSNPNPTEPDAVYEFPVGTILQNGEIYVVAKNKTDFERVFEFRHADDYSVDINGTGNDTYVLRDPPYIIDIYGEIGVDGNSADWKYQDGVAKRNLSVILGNDSWTASEWQITLSSDETPPYNPGVRD